MPEKGFNPELVWTTQANLIKIEVLHVKFFLFH